MAFSVTSLNGPMMWWISPTMISVSMDGERMAVSLWA